MEQELLNNLGINIPGLLTLLIPILIGLVIKDLLSSFSYGIIFYLDKGFNEGDTVFVDGQKAVIVKIGFRRTILKILSTNRWRYISNNKIVNLDLEKEIEKE